MDFRCVPSRFEISLSCGPPADGVMAGEDLVRTRGGEIRRVAQAHGVDTIRWWPPRKADFLIGELPQSLRELRSDLERVLGCRVAIYLVDHQPEEVRRRLTAQTIDLED